MARALYATSFEDLAAFGEREHVDYFLYNKKKLIAPEKYMPAPAKKEIDAIFAAAKAKGMVLADPPAPAVIFREKDFVFLDLKKLSAWVKTHPTEAKPASPFIGPALDPSAPT